MTDFAMDERLSRLMKRLHALDEADVALVEQLVDALSRESDVKDSATGLPRRKPVVQVARSIVNHGPLIVLRPKEP